MRMSQHGLLTLAQTSIVELRFIRRRQKFGWSPYRRMLGTNNDNILRSAPGQFALHFKPPTHPPPYPWIEKNLVCMWDIFWQDWRMVSAESVDVITVFPVQTDEEINKWWAYFGLFLENMSPQDKVAFMNQ